VVSLISLVTCFSNSKQITISVARERKRDKRVDSNEEMMRRLKPIQ
jgi:hypothetical protein